MLIFIFFLLSFFPSFSKKIPVLTHYVKHLPDVGAITCKIVESIEVPDYLFEETKHITFPVLRNHFLKIQAQYKPEYNFGNSNSQGAYLKIQQHQGPTLADINRQEQIRFELTYASIKCSDGSMGLIDVYVPEYQPLVKYIIDNTSDDAFYNLCPALKYCHYGVEREQLIQIRQKNKSTLQALSANDFLKHLAIIKNNFDGKEYIEKLESIYKSCNRIFFKENIDITLKPKLDEEYSKLTPIPPPALEELLKDLGVENNLDQIADKLALYHVKSFMQNIAKSRNIFINSNDIAEKPFRLSLGDRLLKTGFRATQDYAISGNIKALRQINNTLSNALDFIYGFSKELGSEVTNRVFARIVTMPLAPVIGTIISMIGIQPILFISAATVVFQLYNNPQDTDFFKKYREALCSENPDYNLVGKEFFRGLKNSGAIDIGETALSLVIGDPIIKTAQKITQFTKTDKCITSIIDSAKRIAPIIAQSDSKIKNIAFECNTIFNNINFDNGQLAINPTQIINPEVVVNTADTVIHQVISDGAQQYFESDDGLNNIVRQINNIHNSSGCPSGDPEDPEEKNRRLQSLNAQKKNFYKKLCQETGIDETRYLNIKKMASDIAAKPEYIDEMVREVVKMQKIFHKHNVPIDAEHLLLGKINKKTGELEGLHMDWLFKYFKELSIDNKVVLPGGAWGAKISINGCKANLKTFPSLNMLPAEFAEIISANYKLIDFNHLEIGESGLAFSIMITNCGMKIRYVINPRSNAILSVMTWK